MKKLLFLFIVCGMFINTSCEPDTYDDWYYERDEHRGNNPDWGDNNRDNSHNQEMYTITKLYSIVMRRTLPYPFQTYVLEIDNGAHFYMLRYHYNQDLKVGDKISFAVYSYCQNEIAEINGYSLEGSTDASDNSDLSAGEYLIASDPIESVVQSTFDMNVIYSLPFIPFATKFIETEDGNLLFIKQSKLNVELNAGDKFVYSVYTLYPNEILALKKL